MKTYQELLCKQVIDINLQKISKVIRKRIQMNNFQAFHQINRLQINTLTKSHLQNIKHEFLFAQIRNSAKLIYSFYKDTWKNITYVRFLHWRGITFYEKFLAKNRPLIENLCEKKFNSRKIECEAKLKERGAEVEVLKQKINEMTENSNKSMKRLRSYEEKENTLVNKLKSLECEKSKLEDELRQKEEEKKRAEEKRNNIESYLKELEVNYKTLDEQIKDKDYNINVYIREMNEMLDIYEKKSTECGARKEAEDEVNAIPSGISPKNNLQSSFKISTLPSKFILKNSSKSNIVFNKTSNTRINPSINNTSSRGIFVNLSNSNQGNYTSKDNPKVKNNVGVSNSNYK